MIYAKEAILVDGKHHDVGDKINTDKATADMLVRLRRASNDAPVKKGGGKKAAAGSGEGSGQGAGEGSGPGEGAGAGEGTGQGAGAGA
ncbi:hypothetical protein BSL82_02320 [Tardibacter chloracetimidivorans]|uniref:Uncharacterized protein n=1 Tax=Tardibacter chloracetimidivorans TaxID=1921510 RepID=A0A1L3ZRN1_9SPHN|nr:hypothetical protein [Tardibacter chloracetimidivorans]API58283.1 hypothetical protein BSL82_02320 [Tardibacter chloracetimidivorans]